MREKRSVISYSLSPSDENYLTDYVYGTYDTQTGKVRQIKEPVTEDVIYAHLTGKQSYGVYLLVGDKTGALAVDFDQDDLAAPIAYVAGARRYWHVCSSHKTTQYRNKKGREFVDGK